MADRIEREIEEILRRIDDFVPESARARRPGRRMSSPLFTARSWLSARLAAISLNQVMMWSLIVVIGAFFLRAIPGASWLLVAALIVFVTAFVLSLRGRGGKTPKRWRGQPIDLSGPRWTDRLKAWIKGRKRA